MAVRSMTVSLKGFGCAPSEARVTIEALSPGRRLARAGAVFGAGLAAAIIALPIPLVHLILVPGALLLGIVLGAARLRHREVFWSAEGTCPCCGTPQRLGLAGRVFRLPREVFCSNCGRALELGEERPAIRRETGSGHAAPARPR